MKQLTDIQQPIFFPINTDNGYRYGFNGMESDNEVKRCGNSYTTEFRQYDPRLGRWLSLDPMMESFPWMSPFVAFDNNPVYFVDPYGLASEGGPDKPLTKQRNRSTKYNKGKGGNYGKSKDGPGFVSKLWSKAKGLANEIGHKLEKAYDFAKDAVDIYSNLLFKDAKELDEVTITAQKKAPENNSTEEEASHVYWWLLTIDGTLGTFSAGVDEMLGKMKPNEQWRFTKNKLSPLAKKLKLPKIYSTNKLFKKVVKPTLKVAKVGVKKLPGIGLILTASDMMISLLNNQEIKPSHILDLTVAGVGTIPVYGWIVSGVFIIAVGVTYASTGKTIGDYLDEVDWSNIKKIDGFDPNHPIYDVMPTYSPGMMKW